MNLYKTSRNYTILKITAGLVLPPHPQHKEDSSRLAVHSLADKTYNSLHVKC